VGKVDLLEGRVQREDDVLFNGLGRGIIDEVAREVEVEDG
jgi:hypothetical protein